MSKACQVFNFHYPEFITCQFCSGATDWQYISKNCLGLRTRIPRNVLGKCLRLRDHKLDFAYQGTFEKAIIIWVSGGLHAFAGFCPMS
jgi:hypothetical protein